MKTVALAIALLALLAATVGAITVLWTRVNIEIPLIGWVAIAAGAILSIALGAGLMWLSFYSARHGYDDRQEPDDDGF